MGIASPVVLSSESWGKFPRYFYDCFSTNFNDRMGRFYTIFMVELDSRWNSHHTPAYQAKSLNFDFFAVVIFFVLITSVMFQVHRAQFVRLFIFLLR